MSVDLNASDQDVRSTIAGAFAALSGTDDIEVVDNNDAGQEDDQPLEDDLENTEEETDEEDVDNDETDSDEDSEDDEFEDEELDEEDEEDEEEESDETEEPEEDSYESGYLYKPEDSDKEIFLRAEDPETGEFSIYDNRQEAEVGLTRQLAFIGTLKEQNEEIRQKSNSRITELEKDLAIFTSTTSPEAAKQILIKSKLPKEFQAVTDPSSLEGDALKKYKNALIDAEVSAEREVREETARLNKIREDADKAEQEATSHVLNRSSDVKFFGFKNVEDRVAVQKILRSKPEGTEHSYQDIAISIGKAFGSEVADMFLKTLIPSSSEPESKPADKPVTKKKKQQSTPAKKKAKAKKVASKVRRKKKSATGTSTPSKEKPTNARQQIAMALTMGNPGKK